MARKPPCKHGRRKNGRCPPGPRKTSKRKRKSTSTIGTLISTTKLDQATCARNSLRAVMPPGRPDVRIIICCPPSQWRDGKCAVSMKSHVKKKYRLR